MWVYRLRMRQHLGVHGERGVTLVAFEQFFLLTCVNATVGREAARLRERFPAVRASVGLLAGVYSQVTL